MASSSDDLPCRRCFWAAEITRSEDRVWCAHATAHGWQRERPACAGAAYVERKPWHSSIGAYERYASGLTR